MQAEARLGLGQSTDAIRSLAEAVIRRPKNEWLSQQLLVLVPQVSIQDCRWLWKRLLALPSDDAPALDQLKMVLAGIAGDPLNAVRTATPEGNPNWSETRRLRRLWFAEGEYQRGVSAAEPWFQVLEDVGYESTRYDEMKAAAAQVAASPERAELALNFAKQLVAVGWLEEALLMLQRQDRLVDQNLRTSAVFQNCLQQQAWEAKLEDWVRRNYTEYERDGEILGFAEFVDSIAESEDASVVQGIHRAATVRIPMLGWMINPDPNSSPWAQRIAEFGRLAVIGRRVFQPAEFMLLPAFAFARAGPQEAHLAFVEGVTIPSYLQFAGVTYSGAALDRFAYVDVANIAVNAQAVITELNRFQSQRSTILADPIQSAETTQAQLQIGEVGEVTFKLRIRAFELCEARDSPLPVNTRFLADAVDEVLVHEIAHLYDANEYLDSFWSVAGAVWKFMQFGFSPRRFESWLEGRAQCFALVHARNPYLALASCTEQVGASGLTRTSHAAGYTNLLHDFVAVLHRDLDQIPGLERDEVLVQQLHRLSVQEIRAAARAVARQWDVRTAPLPGRPAKAP